MESGSANTGGAPPEQEATLAQHGRLLQEASTAVQTINTRLQNQERLQQGGAVRMDEIMTAIQTLSERVAALASSPAPPLVPPLFPAPPLSPPPAPPPALSREPALSSPRPFDGTFALFRGFLMQCELIFFHQPSQFTLPAARVAFITNLTTGYALDWAQATLSTRPELFNNYELFLIEFKRVFDHSSAGQDVGVRLMSLSQGDRTTAAYSIEFRTLAAGSGWNDAGLRSAFRRGLSESIKDELVRDKPATLEELIQLSIDVDERVRERRGERARHPVNSPRYRNVAPALTAPRTTSPPSTAPVTTSPTVEEPMQLGRARLTTAEKERRRIQGLCLYCGVKGHLRDTCPALPKE